MKRIYLAAVFAMASTVACAEDVSCDLVGDEPRDTFGFIRENAKALFIFAPNSVDLLSVPMWCGGNTCVSLEDGDDNRFDDGKLIIHGPARTYDQATQNFGEPTYSIWLRESSDRENIEELVVSCAE